MKRSHELGRAHSSPFRVTGIRLRNASPDPDNSVPRARKQERLARLVDPRNRRQLAGTGVPVREAAVPAGEKKKRSWFGCVSQFLVNY